MAHLQRPGFGTWCCDQVRIGNSMQGPTAANGNMQMNAVPDLSSQLESLPPSAFQEAALFLERHRAAVNGTQQQRGVGGGLFGGINKSLGMQQESAEHGPATAPSQQSGTAASLFPVGQILTSNTQQPAAAALALNMEEIYQYIGDLTISSKREKALLELSRRREMVPDLAPLLWHSFGVITAILQEIIAIYSQLTPPTLTSMGSNRVCNALALLQCVASHPDTRRLFLNANIPLFLYPFLNTISASRPFEYLRLTSLGVIGALVKVDDPEVIGFLLQTEIMSLCLRIMEMGSELSKTVATFIVQKILLDDLGLRYVCATPERFYALNSVLGGMVTALAEAPSSRLLKHIVKCYLRLADNSRTKEALKRCIPPALKDGSLLGCIREDAATKQNVLTLLALVDANAAQQLLESSIVPAPDVNFPQLQQQQQLQQFHQQHHQLQQQLQIQLQMQQQHHHASGTTRQHQAYQQVSSKLPNRPNI